MGGRRGAKVDRKVNSRGGGNRCLRLLSKREPITAEGDAGSGGTSPAAQEGACARPSSTEEAAARDKRPRV